MYLYEVVINARNNIFFSFFFFHSQMPPRGAFGLRIAMAPWDCINPYIRLNPSSRKFRCGSTGDPTCDLFSIFFFYFQLDTRTTSLTCANHLFLSPRDSREFFIIMFTKLRLFVLSIVVASQVSWLVSVPRGKMFVHSQRYFSSGYYVLCCCANFSEICNFYLVNFI